MNALRSLFQKKENLIAATLITTSSIILILPALLASGIWKTFDSPFHISMIAQFHSALKYGQFPVVWTDGVANYGLPFGIIAHPLTSYLGGLITFLTNDPLLSYKILWLIFSVISSWGMYRLLKKYFGIWPSVAGTILYTFTAYHILNIYIRGALPEFAAASWLPFLLSTLLEEKDKKNFYHSFIYLTCWYALIFFTHPMFLLFSVFLTALFLISYRPSKKFWLTVMAAGFIAVLINMFYLLPLNLEMKYFYMGRESNFLAKGSGLNADRFFIEQWEYTCSNGDSPAYRCNRVQTGFPEILMVLSLPSLYFFTKEKNRKKLLLFIAILGSTSTLMLLNILQPIYEKIPLLGSIQFLFRFLNIWILIPPIILALLLDTVKRYKMVIIALFIFAILCIRLPQLYVKNVTNPPKSFYYHNADNIHSVMMNTIWMGEPKTYKKQSFKGAIISGKGKIITSNTSPTNHFYTIRAENQLIFADYTFYFPGWHVYIDGIETPIQWQDPNHRGYITFSVPKGNHSIRAAFEDTAIRFIGKLISLLTIIGLFIFLVFQKYGNSSDKISTFYRKTLSKKILLFFGGGVMLNILIMPWKFHGDMTNYDGWGKYILEHGSSTIYNFSFRGQLLSNANYPPLMLALSTLVSRIVMIIRDIIWQLNLHIPVFPSKLVFFSQGELLYIYIFKLILIFANTAIAWLIYLFVKRRKQRSNHEALVGAMLFLLNPAIIYGSTIWGQIDILPILFILASIYVLFYRKQIIFSSILTAVAILFKQTTVIFLPIYILAVLKYFGMKNFLKSVFVICFVLWIGYAPFVPKWTSMLSPFEVYLHKVQLASDNNLTTKSAWNMWVLFHNFHEVSDLQKVLLGISYNMMGYGLVLVSLIIILISYWKNRERKIVNNVQTTLCAYLLIAVASFLFLTRLHERHLLQAIPFFILLYKNTKNFYSQLAYITVFIVVNLFFVWHPITLLIQINVIQLTIIKLSIVLIIIWYLYHLNKQVWTTKNIH